MAINPAARAEAVLAQVNRDHNGTGYVLAGLLSGGSQGGAWRIVGPDGGSAVLKWSKARGNWARVVLAAEQKVAEARQRGYPTPAWVVAGLTDNGFVYQVQELVPGQPVEYLTEPLARQLVDVLERCAAGHPPDPGDDPRSDWSQFVLSRMGDAADSLPAQVSELGPHATAVVERVLALLDRIGPIRLPADDLVHGDLNRSNVLVDADGRLASIVDIEALGAGSRAIDYATLWHSSADKGDEAALSLVRAAGERAAGPNGFVMCALWVALEYITFGANVDGAAGSDRAVAAAHRRLDRLEVPHDVPLAYLLVGLTGSGKTTYARGLEAKGALRLSVDEEVFARNGRYGFDYPDHEYPDRERPVVQDLQQRLIEAIHAGQDVVLDYGLWTREEREAYKRMVEEAGGQWRLIYLRADKAELLRRLGERNLRQDANALVVTPEMLDDFYARFDEPFDEGAETVMPGPADG